MSYPRKKQLTLPSVPLCLLLALAITTFPLGLRSYAQPVLIGVEPADPASSAVLMFDTWAHTTETVVSDVPWLQSVAVDTAALKAYVGRGYKEIWRYNLDGSDAEIVLDSQTFEALHDTQSEATSCDHLGISLDTIAGKYYAVGSCWGHPHVIRGNLDGTEVEWIAPTEEWEGIGVPFMDIEVDAELGKIYIAGGSRILRADTDGANPEVLVESENGNNIWDLALDASKGKMYWVGNFAAIRTANLDGSEIEDVVILEATPGHDENGIALDLANSTLYYADGDTLYRSNMDGSDYKSIGAFGVRRLVVVPGQVGSAIDEGPTEAIPFELHSYPNPFTDWTTISYTLPERMHVALEIFDIMGHRVRMPVDEEESRGTHSLRWDGSSETGVSLPSGFYLIKLSSERHVEVTRAVRVR